MIRIVTPTVSPNAFVATGRAFRLVTGIVMLSVLAACAATPSKPATTESTTQAKARTGMDAAANMYNSGDYGNAVREFDNIISDNDSSANNRRLAHLGKALVYLGNDSDWHSIANAKMSLISAGQVAPEGDEEFSVETDLLMDAVSAVIGSESKYTMLKERSGGSNTQVAKLKEEAVALEAERDELLEEQIALHEALEKLKELTLGN